MMTHIRSTDFARREDGTTAILFALALLPIIVVFGFAVDFQRAHSANLQIQATADAAALAGARQFYEGGDQAEAIAKAYFDTAIAHVPHGAACSDPVIAVDEVTGTVTVDANCSLQTTIAGIIGEDKIDLSTTATARAKSTKLDLALMLDVSGSMKGSKLKDLKTAAKSAVDILTAGSGGDTRIALAPYSTSVNLGAYTETVVGSDNYDEDRDHATCVTERPGIAKKTDEAPEDDKWIGYEEESTDGKDISCPVSEFLPLTGNVPALKSEIDALKAKGRTAGQLGIAWSWYAIAPSWENIWPEDSKPLGYDDPDVIKSVILMTDGRFNITYDDDQGNSVNQSKVLCKEMREAGVQIYSVAFKAPASGQAVLQNCASSPDHYFEPENGDELISVYEEIATSLSDLRLSN